MASKSQKTNYVNEIELKALLIRAKNRANKLGTTKWNDRIKELVDLYIKTDKLRQTSRVLQFRKALKDHIIWGCERSIAGDREMNRLSSIIDIMVDRILTKPQFSGYTYVDEFHSDVQFKVFKYIDNFDHRKISKRSGDYVNAFAYITQIIHNSIIYVISTNKKAQDRIKAEYRSQQIQFAIENPGIKPLLVHENEHEVEAEPVKMTRYYYNKSTFFADFKADLERLDFSKISELTVYVPKGCKVEDFTGYNVKFKEL